MYVLNSILLSKRKQLLDKPGVNHTTNVVLILIQPLVNLGYDVMYDVCTLIASTLAQNLQNIVFHPHTTHYGVMSHDVIQYFNQVQHAVININLSFVCVSVCLMVLIMCICIFLL